jgi:transposase InsO family protein
MKTAQLQFGSGKWIEEYNNHRPHESLNNLTPTEW